LVRREFSTLLNEVDENKIRENFQESASLLDDDINPTLPPKIYNYNQTSS